MKLSFNPNWTDEQAEIAWQTRGLTPETPRPNIFPRLMALTPTLARLSHLEAGAILEDLKKRLELPERIITDLRRDVKAERQAREETKDKKGKGAALDVKNLDESFRLHPAIHFLSDAMTIGFRVNLGNDTGLLLLISDGQGVRAEVNPETVEIGERVYQIIQNTVPPFVQDVWSLNGLKAFLEHPTRPQDLYKMLVAAFKHYLDLPEPAYGLLAAWAVGTYFAHLFTAFPFLHFHGPKESGKSKSLEAGRCVCLNAWKGRDISAAALGDTMDGQHGTLLLDQAEKLNSDKENGNLIGLLADSYKKAGGQRRVVEVTKAGRSVLEFSTYGPKAFASTKPLDPDLADRCVKVPMTRTRRRLPDLEGWEPVWGELRDALYRFSLAAFKEVRAHYEANHGNGTRIGELWRPMLAVLLALGVEQGEIEAIRVLFMAGAEEGRHELTSWEVALFEALKAESETVTGSFEMSAQEIINAMGLGDDGPGPKWIGEVLSRFHLFMRRKQPRTGGKRTRVYEFSPARVRELCEIYFRDTPPNDLCHLCQGGEDSNSESERGTGKKCGTCANPCRERKEQAGTRDNQETCATESPVNTGPSKVAQVEHVKSGGVSEKNINLFSGEEIQL